MRLSNFWLIKANEKSLLKIVEWAQKNGRQVKSLTQEEVKEALKSQR
jgi:hypothetical protein